MTPGSAASSASARRQPTLIPEEAGDAGYEYAEPESTATNKKGAGEMQTTHRGLYKNST